MNNTRSHSIILIVDDAPENRKALRDLLQPEGYKILVANNGGNALRIATEAKPDLILLDVVMPPGIDGYEVCLKLKQNDPTKPIPVIFMTAFRKEDSDIVKGFHVGSVDYITKPFHPEEVLLRVKTHLEINRLTKILQQKNNELEKQTTELIRANTKLQLEIAERRKAEYEREQAKADLVWAEEQLSLVSQLSAVGFIGQSETIERNILNPIQKLNANDTIPVLITGESGTGKELITQAIHFGGPRAKMPFVPVNCAAISDQLVESELFGHLKGAFTGANQNRVGRFQEADGGTIFLDEIGDMKPDIQAKILRVLQEGEVVKVGSNRPIKVNVRVIAATNKDIETEVATGRFRADLYYRLKGIHISVPPLRERRDDIPLLVRHFFKKYAREMNISSPRISPEALAMLENYHFPGNVRELEMTIRAALTLNEGREIQPKHLNLTAVDDSSRTETVLPPPEKTNRVDAEQLMLERTRTQDEKRILAYIRQHGSINNQKCRELLSVDKPRASYLLKKMYHYGLLEREGENRWAQYVLKSL